jgi:hypothetical protein
MLLIHPERSLIELWSNSGRALVLTGSVFHIFEMAEKLQLPADAVVSVTRQTNALVLWGDVLDVYLKHFRSTDEVIEADAARCTSDGPRSTSRVAFATDD